MKLTLKKLAIASVISVLAVGLGIIASLQLGNPVPTSPALITESPAVVESGSPNDTLNSYCKTQSAFPGQSVTTCVDGIAPTP